MFLLAGLALGFAIGSKYTFVVPAVALAAGTPFVARVGTRARIAALIVGGLVLTGGWWYLRDVIAVGNPVGLRLHISPLSLAGAHSPLAD